jgi:hypothetical protein
MGVVVAYRNDGFCRIFIPFLLPCDAGDNAAQVTSQSHSLSRQLASGEQRRSRNNSFLTERCGNVIENKGPLWKRSSGGGDVIDYKGDIHIKR